MRYRYCPKCNELRPRAFLASNLCDSCRGDAMDIQVPRSIYGRAMYVAEGLAIILLFLYLAHYQYDAAFASFLDGVDSTVIASLIFVLIVASFILAFLDLGRTNRKAREIIDQRKGRVQ